MGREREERRKILYPIFFRVSIRIPSGLSTSMFANSAFAVSRVAEHPMEDLAWPNSVGQFPFGPFQPSLPFFLPRRPSTALPTRIGNQFRKTVINGCRGRTLRCLALPA